MKRSLAFPTRKKYPHKISTDVWSMTMEYMQATAEETIMFYEVWIKNEWMDTFLTEMINDPKNTFEVDGKPALEDKSSTNEDTKHITGQKYNIVQTILSDPNKILTEIIDRMHRRHVSLYDGIEIPTVRWEKGKPISPRKSFEGVAYARVCREWNIPGPNALLSEYTMEQVWYMLDTIRYSDYEQIKDTKVANDRMWKKINGGLDDDQKALLKHIKDQKKKYAHLTKK